MQDIEQNMDDLFRKAADNYPLKVNDSQWDDIAPGLGHKPVNSASAKKFNSKKYAGLLLFFLSLFLTDGIITNTFKNNKAIYPLRPSAENNTNTSTAINEPTENTYTNNKKEEKKPVQLKQDFLQPITQSITTYSSLLFKKETIQKQVIVFKDKAGKSSQPSAFAVTDPNPFVNTITNTTNTLASVIKNETFIEVNKMENEKEETGQKENPEPAKKSIGKKHGYNQTGIYLGAVAGPLLDEIKNQGLKKTGFSIGIIAGYQFKKNLSVETGLLFAKKPYFSTGKYFSMDKISNSMPQGMEILSLVGNNFVLEIPARVKYDFLHRDKSHFFSTAGITSYIMTYEKNNYLVSINGAQQTMISSYKNKSRSLAATLDISAGYEHKIGKNNHIRIEPYIQIPLKGMGVGSMPMMSSGLRIGITKFTN